MSPLSKGYPSSVGARMKGLKIEAIFLISMTAVLGNVSGRCGSGSRKSRRQAG